ncbi:MAG: MCE family protein [Crocinitomicaceae bacterium]|nr:MCE family protein [Crocinitomicaceae bacterium]
MKVSKEFKVGLLVVLGLLLLFVGVNFLKGGLIFGKSREFYAVYDNASGLKASNEVQLNGVKIGQVLSVELHPANPRKILVKFNIDDNELQIPSNSSAWLISSDILGTKCLDLRLDTNVAVTHEYYEDGDTMISNMETSLQDQVEQQLLPLKMKTEELIGSVEGIVVSINAFWDTSAAYTIEESMYEVRQAIGTFGDLANNLSILISKETEMVGKILGDVHDITENLANKSDQISNTIDNISAISDTLADSDLKSVILETKTTLVELNDVLAKVNEGEGTLGALLHTDSLHNALITTNQSVQHLLDDMAANPQKYVHFSLFGRKVKGVQLTPAEEQKLKQLLNQ